MVFIVQMIFFIVIWGGLAITQTKDKKERKAWLEKKVDESQSAEERSYYIERLSRNK